VNVEKPLARFATLLSISEPAGRDQFSSQYSKRNSSTHHWRDARSRILERLGPAPGSLIVAHQVYPADAYPASRRRTSEYRFAQA